MNVQRKLNTREAADLYNLAPNTLECWRCKNRGPKYAKIGRRVLYAIDDLEAFFTAHSIETAESQELTQRTEKKA